MLSQKPGLRGVHNNRGDLPVLVISTVPVEKAETMHWYPFNEYHHVDLSQLKQQPEEKIAQIVDLIKAQQYHAIYLSLGISAQHPLVCLIIDNIKANLQLDMPKMNIHIGNYQYILTAKQENGNLYWQQGEALFSTRGIDHELWQGMPLFDSIEDQNHLISGIIAGVNAPSELTYMEKNAG